MKPFGALALVLLLGGCGQEADIPAMEDEIAQGILDQTEIEATVDCPEVIDWNPGGDFRCVAEGDDGSSALVTVYMENAEGDWTWQVE